MASIETRIRDIIRNGPELSGRAARFIDWQTRSAHTDTRAGVGARSGGGIGTQAGGVAQNRSLGPGIGHESSATGRDVRGSHFAAELETMIQAEARQQAISPDLIRAVVQAESAGQANARSKAGAIGLMQLMPGTAQQLGVDPHDPAQNLHGGVQYLNDMARQFGDLDLALAAYNAGPGAVKKYGGVPPYRETIDYVRRIRRALGEPSR